jgi:DNA-binding NarL/FixJ family response regulator
MSRIELTPRQLEVLKLISEGFDYKSIAGKLFISVGTVKIHASDILARNQATNMIQLAVAAVRQGII